MICNDKSCSPPGQWTLPDAVLTVVSAGSDPLQTKKKDSDAVRTSVSAGTDSPQPRRKDSNARFKPKGAELTTAVEPSEAKPGDTVTFKVTAKVGPSYHIYKYAKISRPPGGGPSFTTFDFFDTAGLKIAGDWTASKEPSKHKDPNFPALAFVEYYEDEVTWSITLEVSTDSTPGQKTLRLQAGYMVCNEKSCSVDRTVDIAGCRVDDPHSQRRTGGDSHTNTGRRHSDTPRLRRLRPRRLGPIRPKAPVLPSPARRARRPRPRSDPPPKSRARSPRRPSRA